MAGVGSNIHVITIKVKDLDFPVKRQKLSGQDFKRKKKSIYMVYKENTFKLI